MNPRIIGTLASDSSMLIRLENWCRNPPAHAPVEPVADGIGSFQQHHVLDAGRGQVIRGAGADDATSDDDDVGRRAHDARPPRRAPRSRSSNASPTDLKTVTSEGARPHDGTAHDLLRGRRRRGPVRTPLRRSGSASSPASAIAASRVSTTTRARSIAAVSSSRDAG